MESNEPDDTNDPFDLSERVVVITGGSRGLGREMAIAFAARGATVVVASRKEPACIELADHLTSTFGTPALGIGCHVGTWEDCDNLIATTIDRFGGIDVLVNNAGMSPLYDSLSSVTEALFDKVIDVNLKGTFRLSALAGEHMEANSGGVILNVSSIAAVQPSKMELAYGAAKAGVNALTLGLARSFGPTVRVNCIMAGPFFTDISKAWDLEAFNQHAAQRIPLGRGGEPNEIVGTALYLCSDASSFTTGSIIKVDGGMAWSSS